MTLLSVGVMAVGDFAQQRARMVEEINDMAAYTESYTGKSRIDNRVSAVMAQVPRHEFVPESIKSHAYVNSALPIDYDQTISQPFIVALMTDLAAVEADDQVLEVGTGSGYQAAVLAQLVNHVFSVEIIEGLGHQARKNLDKLGYNNISLRIGDGYHGWPEYAPFDAILVTAAVDTVPGALIEQLAPGGRLVIPLGPQNRTQTLTIIEKGMDGSLREEAILPVGFVPLTGTH